jgi:hypothetical protein
VTGLAFPPAAAGDMPNGYDVLVSCSADYRLAVLQVRKDFPVAYFVACMLLMISIVLLYFYLRNIADEAQILVQ